MDEALNTAKGKVGGASALATALGISSQAVTQWERVPSARVLDVERITGVSRYELRPDLYGEPSSVQREAAEPTEAAS